MNLSGKWECRLLGIGEDIKKENPNCKFEGEITLPGTTEMAGLGVFHRKKGETLMLNRDYAYTGKAEYTKNIVVEAGNYELFLERTKYTEVFLDGEKIGYSHETVISQRYALSVKETGEHKLTIVVDNDLTAYEDFHKDMYSGHQYTDHTQTNWNGVIGQLELRDEKACEAEKNTEKNSKEIKIEGRKIYVDGKRINLRGNVDCCIFPKTGYPPMTVEEWKEYFENLKQYGMNHVRFHSWCPNDACFTAADELDMFLQIELSCFGVHVKAEGTEVVKNYLSTQAEKVIQEYGHHRSFLIFAIGNELRGESAPYTEILQNVKKLRKDIIFTQGANNFLEAPFVNQEDEIFVSMRTTKGGGNIRASFAHTDLPLGKIQEKSEYGNDYDFDEAVEMTHYEDGRNVTLPVISHETGQYQVCPDFDEMNRYTGHLHSTALEEFKERMEKMGTFEHWKEYFDASGAWMVSCYKEEIEAALRSDALSGFQLLGINDFPGQGSAYVGILNAFYENKGLISPEEWREFCNNLVVLGRFKKFVYASDEVMEVHLNVYNYREDVSGEVSVEIPELGICEKVSCTSPEGALTDCGSVKLKLTLPANCTSRKYQVLLKFADVQNHYDIWVYNTAVSPKEKDSVRIAAEMTEELCQYAEEGGKVILCSEKEGTVEGFMPTDFWCYSMFYPACIQMGLEPEPGTMGLLIHKDHPAMAEFATDSYSGWEWGQILSNGTGAVLDEDKDVDIIVQIMDNFDNNHIIGFIYEKAMGKGTVLTVCTNYEKLKNRPEGKCLLASLQNYLNSK